MPESVACRLPCLASRQVELNHDVLLSPRLCCTKTSEATTDRRSCGRGPLNGPELREDSVKREVLACARTTLRSARYRPDSELTLSRTVIDAAGLLSD